MRFARFSWWVKDVHVYLIGIFTAVMKQHEEDAAGCGGFERGLSEE